MSLENNCIFRIKDEIARATNLEGMSNDKLASYLQEWILLNKKRDHLLDLDESLKEYMHATKNNNEVIEDYEFHKKVEDISEDSLIIYVKKAQLYKVYNRDGIDDFTQDAGTHYRKSEYGPTYEVVRDTHPQKLMIVVQDDIQEKKLNTIKQHIMEFISKKPTYSRMNKSDFMIYNCDNNTEIVVSSLKFKNIQEKEIFIEEFIIFMQECGQGEIANKIQIRRPPSNIPGTRYYELPCSKTLIEGTSRDIVTELITAPRTSPSVIINNTYIIQNNVGNVNNTINNINTPPVDESTSKTIKSFCKYIILNKPQWYKENKQVNFDIIENAYREYFDDNETIKSVISRQLKGHLYNSGTRVNKTVKKKLLSYDMLERQCMD